MVDVYMTNILVRSGVDPRDSYTTLDYLNRDLGGGNSGNLLFAASIFRNLNENNRELESNYYKLDCRKIDEINEKYQYFVVPLANAFRPNFRELEKLTAFIKRLKIPCIVTGVGGQFDFDPDFSEDFEFDKKAQDFCFAVLDKCSSIGVRGTITADYLKKIKVPEDKIDVIGCPSVFWHGSTPPPLHLKKKLSNHLLAFMQVHQYAQIYSIN